MQRLLITGAIAGAVALCVLNSAQAQSPEALAACAKIGEEKARLICFDAVAKAAAQPAAPAASDPSVSTKTADVVKPATAKEVKVVSVDDLYVAPDKYTGRPIEVRRVRCFHADKNEYRCIGSTSAVIIFAANVQPDAARAALEDQCGEIAKVAKSPKCLKNIRFTPLRNAQDTVSGYQNRIGLVAEQIEIVK